MDILVELRPSAEGWEVLVARLLVRLMGSVNVLDVLTFLLNHTIPIKRDLTKAAGVSDSEN